MEASVTVANPVVSSVGGSSIILSRKTTERLNDIRPYLGKPGGDPKPRIRGRKAKNKALRNMQLVGDHWPRHEPAFQVIREAFPDFTWERNTRGCGVRFHGYPTVNYQHPTLADLVIETVRRQEFPEAPVHIKVIDDLNLLSLHIQRHMQPLINVGPKGIEFARVLANLPIAYPPLQIMEAVAHWLQRALAGEESTIAIPVCPDYATRESDDLMRTVVYTFDGLNAGIGLVAKRALNALPHVWEFLKSRNLRHVKFVVAIADSEADVQANLDRVKLDRATFLDRLRASQHAFAAACPAGMPVETPMLTQINRNLWDTLIVQAREAVENGNWGALQLSEEDKRIITESRRPLLERWYGREVNTRAKLEAQIPEYLAVGDLFRRSYPNVLTLGADAVAMAPFSHGLPEGIKPVLFLRNVNY